MVVVQLNKLQIGDEFVRSGQRWKITAMKYGLVVAVSEYGMVIDIPNDTKVMVKEYED